MRRLGGGWDGMVVKFKVTNKRIRNVSETARILKICYSLSFDVETTALCYVQSPELTRAFMACQTDSGYLDRS